ncbi:hypothetical protein FA13DRAFT_1726455 [Coprinellus micaceus]|uniref:Uncharacterized protein n=1 Tax=Coprinellus micaceus TaxID=71717 RepID=A0A4Y7SRI3_COPMI|nr:hypothetical protein FA13DRAFT_1741114 [Coprinellus micaceus]TEB23869.1 hypothetical protein FA13DRAFT_1739667 [Coprinellus micaceus]TEB37372.1 hypothetical protein FA13DRAFT_1726455 [Coprinellus micaceus]
MLPPHCNSLLAQARALNRQGARRMLISVTVMRLMTGLEVKVFSECLAGIVCTTPITLHCRYGTHTLTCGWGPLDLTRSRL